MYSVRIVLSAVALAAVPLLATAQESCSHESWQISGAPVRVDVCAERSGAAAVLAIHVSGPNGDFTDRKPVHYAPNVGPSRVIENVALAQVGLHGVLHLSLAYDGDHASVESALLTPGAIQLK